MHSNLFPPVQAGEGEGTPRAARQSSGTVRLASDFFRSALPASPPGLTPPSSASASAAPAGVPPMHLNAALRTPRVGSSAARGSEARLSCSSVSTPDTVGSSVGWPNGSTFSSPGQGRATELSGAEQGRATELSGPGQGRAAEVSGAGQGGVTEISGTGHSRVTEASGAGQGSVTELSGSGQNRVTGDITWALEGLLEQLGQGPRVQARSASEVLLRAHPQATLTALAQSVGGNPGQCVGVGGIEAYGRGGGA